MVVVCEVVVSGTYICHQKFVVINNDLQWLMQFLARKLESPSDSSKHCR